MTVVMRSEMEAYDSEIVHTGLDITGMKIFDCRLFVPLATRNNSLSLIKFYRIDTDFLPSALRSMMPYLVARCRRGASYHYYPASTVFQVVSLLRLLG